MPEALSETLERHGEMKSVRHLEEPHWRDIALILRPDDRDFDAHIQRRRDDTGIFDCTQIYALEDFAGGLFTQLTNPENRWFGLKTPDDELNDWQPVKSWLWRRTNNLLASCSEAVSNFYSECPAWFSTIGAFGLGAMYSEEKIGERRIVDLSIPIGQSYIETDGDGELNRFHREFPMTGRQAKRKFKRDIDARDEARYVFAHAVYPNEDYVPGALGKKRGARYCSSYVSPDLRGFHIPDYYWDMPYSVPTWNKRSGRPYPTGPGHISRADMLMLQEIERSNMVGIQFEAEPPILVHDKSVLTAADIEPNAVLFGTMNSQNSKANIQYLERQQQMRNTLAYAEQRRNAIRTAFRYGIMQLLQRPEMTATEFMGFQREILRTMGPNLVRIQTGGLSPHIGRRFRMLERAGAWADDPPPPELAGKPIVIEYQSPLAKMLKVDDAQGARQWVEGLGEYAKLSGDASVFDVVNRDRYATVLHAGTVGDPTLINDPETVKQTRQARAAAIEQQQKMAMLEQAAAAHADISHAEQARTLAAQRSVQ